MDTCYFDQKIAQYILNILKHYPHFITYRDTIKVWHKMFNDKELKKISREINNLGYYLNSKKIGRFTSQDEDPKLLQKEIEEKFYDIDFAEEIFAEVKSLSKEKRNKINAIIIKNIEQKNKKRKEVKTPRLNEIKDLFKLNDVEIELITLYFCAENSDSFQDLVHRNEESEDIRQPSNSKYFISHITSFSANQITMALKKSSPLVALGIIESGRKKSISDEFIDYLSELSSDNLIEKYAKKMSTENSLDLSTHLTPAKKLETLKAILQAKSPCSILFYGKPGTGKTELARSMAKEVNLDLYAINTLDNDGDIYLDQRKRSLHAVQNHPLISENIILIDECDQLINSKINFLHSSNSIDDHKAWLNEYLDLNKSKMIWITNSLEYMDDSIVRRFNYILEFDDLSTVQRERIIKTIYNKNNCTFLKDEDIKYFSKFENLNSGNFSIAVKTVESLNVDDETKKDFFKNILSGHQELLGNKPLRLKEIHSDYCIKGLNIDQPPATIIKQTRKIIELIETNDSDINLNTLLYGPPGTGKTEFVKYLGQELDKEILLKRASDLLSMYVGGSEKNIRMAFEEAEKDKKILFIDEADSLLSSRDGHQRSWETSQVNELLTCMENFKGILVCATNHLDHLDMAAQRRFLFKLKFDYLNKDGVLHFYEKFLSKFADEDLTGSQKKEVELISGLTPSDFNNLKRKFEILKPDGNEDILKQLRIEVSYKKNLFKKKLGIN